VTFKCLENCASCCFVAPIDKEIWDKHQEDIIGTMKTLIPYGKYVVPITTNGICPFLKNDKKCNIYEDRPKICRDYGLIKEMPCIFLDKNGKLRDKNAQRHIMKFWADKETIMKTRSGLK